jgi:transposase
MFMAFTGLVPCEDSSGDRTRRGRITHAGNGHLRAQLGEAAWAYKSRPATGAVIKRRHDGLDPAVVARAWAAQLSLRGKFRRLDARKTVVTAVARELAGFVWAEMTA